MYRLKHIYITYVTLLQHTDCFMKTVPSGYTLITNTINLSHSDRIIRLVVAGAEGKLTALCIVQLNYDHIQI